MVSTWWVTGFVPKKAPRGITFRFCSGLIMSVVSLPEYATSNNELPGILCEIVKLYVWVTACFLSVGSTAYEPRTAAHETFVPLSMSPNQVGEYTAHFLLPTAVDCAPA